MSVKKNLFGGAITALLPRNSCDISEMREVPDNQEVFAHAQSDQSLLIDLMSYLEDMNDQDSLIYHYKDITGECNENDRKIKDVKKLDMTLPPECDSVYYLNGEHYQSKYKESAKNLVNIHLVLLRYKKYDTDILITFNDTVYINPESSSFAATNSSAEKWTLDDFMTLVNSFTIVNFGLFQP